MSQHQTPLRYPGGKQRLAPFIAELLVENEATGGHYAEAYAGGAGVALLLLLANYVTHIHLNDASFPIYAFWNSVINQTESVCRFISSASLTVEEWKRQRDILQHPDQHSEFDVGMSAFYLNRCNRSGILSGGLIGGITQNGEWKMDARFSRKELLRRVEVVASKGDFITARNLDAEKFILEYIPSLPENTFVYCDPPYVNKSNRLYLNRYDMQDHARIAEIIQNHLPRKWVVSYDGVAEIQQHYHLRKKFLYDLQYSASRVYKGQEIFIFSDDVRLPAHSSLPYINGAMQAHEMVRIA